MFLTFTAILVLSNFIFDFPIGLKLESLVSPAEGAIGDLRESVRLTSIFGCGAAFQLMRLKYRAPVAAACAIGLIAALFSPLLAEVALMTLGGYLLFWVAFNVRWRPLQTINAKDDISYGVYLYAWPVGMMIILVWSTISALALTGLTLAASIVLGAASWFLVEKPALSLKGRFQKTGDARRLAPSREPASERPVTR